MLNGSRVLVVEDETLVAEDLRQLLTDPEGTVIGPLASVTEARQLLKSGAKIDLALLDVNLSDGPVTPLLEALQAGRIPTVVYTGGAVSNEVRQRHPSLTVLAKPIFPARLIAELRRAKKSID